MFADNIRNNQREILIHITTFLRFLCQFFQPELKEKRMGLECTKVTQHRRESTTQRRVSPNVSQLQNINDMINFNIRVHNLKLLNFSQTFHTIRIFVDNDFSFQLYPHDFTIHDKIWTSQKTFSSEIQGPLSLIANKIMVISILDKLGNIVDQLKMKLSHLSTGPVKHDHLLKNFKSRFLFDCHIDQYLDVNVSIKNFNLSLNSQGICREESQYLLSIIFSNMKTNFNETKKYQKHFKIKQIGLQPFSIKSSQLNQGTIRLNLTFCGHQDDHIEFYLPCVKMFQNSAYKLKNKGNKVFEEREVDIQEDVFIKGEKVGTVSFTFAMTKTKLYVEQMDCVIFSQNGIVTTTPTDFQSKEKELNFETIINYHRKLREGKSQGMSDYQFYKLMQQLLILLKQGKEFNIDDDLFKTQSIILEFILELEDSLEENRVVKNEYIWNILHLILHKKVMSLRYFGILHQVNAQKKYALKYYTFLVRMIVKIIGFISSGISFKQVEPLQRFIAFCFFRLTWVQDQIIQALAKESDPVVSEDKLAQLGASRRAKSPSKSFIFDWETNVLNMIKNDEDFLKMMGKLQKANKDNPKWAGLLFDREYQQLFYGLFSQLWDQAQIFLINNRQIMWQYFPRYGQLLSLFFGEMNDSGIIDFCAEMTKCNMKLIKNQKLLNTFMMLIFPKTCLYQTYSVMKCLDLINCYFLVISQNNKKIPMDFNYNYFYTGIRCILESNHSILLQLMLSILYKYYDIFTKEFIQSLNHYIVNNVFNQLFMHWNQQVRTLFHLLLAFKISKTQINNPQANPKMSFSLHQERSHHCQAINQNIMYLREMKKEEKKGRKPEKKEYYQKMKDKLQQKRSKYILMSSPSIESLESIQSSPTKSISNFTDSFTSPLIAKRKWSLVSSHQHERNEPNEHEIGYLTTSLKEFDELKKEKNPDAIVEERSKMLQLNIDE